MDTTLFETINGFAGHNALIDSIFIVISNYGPYLLLGLMAVLWFWPDNSSFRDRRQWAVIIAVLGVAAALLVNQVIIHLWARPRPFVVHAATMLLPPSTEPSFPSDHATFGFAIVVALLSVSRSAGIFAFFLAALIAFSRVYVGEHYLSDVVAGALIGGVITLLMMRAQPYLEPVVRPVLRLARRLKLT